MVRRPVFLAESGSLIRNGKAAVGAG